jgi:hypothetical protein
MAPKSPRRNGVFDLGGRDVISSGLDVEFRREIAKSGIRFRYKERVNCRNRTNRPQIAPALDILKL